MRKATLKKNREYAAFFEENELGGFTVAVPALPGLVTEVKDMRQAREVLSDAITCCIEGLEVASI